LGSNVSNTVYPHTKDEQHKAKDPNKYKRIQATAALKLGLELILGLVLFVFISMKMSIKEIKIA